MRVTCPYCDSIVEANANIRCPNCGGSISEEVKQAEIHYMQMQDQAAAQERKRQEDERDERLLETIIPVVGAVLGGGFGRGLIRGAIKNAIRFSKNK